jgi:hypothetical protein
VFTTLAEYFEKRFRRQRDGIPDIDGTSVVGKNGKWRTGSMEEHVCSSKCPLWSEDRD